MNPTLTPPSAALLPAVPDLRARLAVALQEVDLLRRLLRVVLAHTATPPSTSTAPTPPEGKVVDRV